MISSIVRRLISAFATFVLVATVAIILITIGIGLVQFAKTGSLESGLLQTFYDFHLGTLLVGFLAGAGVRLLVSIDARLEASK